MEVKDPKIYLRISLVFVLFQSKGIRGENWRQTYFRICSFWTQNWYIIMRRVRTGKKKEYV